MYTVPILGFCILHVDWNSAIYGLRDTTTGWRDAFPRYCTTFFAKVTCNYSGWSEICEYGKFENLNSTMFRKGLRIKRKGEVRSSDSERS